MEIERKGTEMGRSNEEESKNQGAPQAFVFCLLLPRPSFSESESSKPPSQKTPTSLVGVGYVNAINANTVAASLA